MDSLILSFFPASLVNAIGTVKTSVSEDLSEDVAARYVNVEGMLCTKDVTVEIAEASETLQTKCLIEIMLDDELISVEGDLAKIRIDDCS